MKWCVIGAGGIADRRTIPAILKDKDNVIVALMDRSETVAKKTGEKYGVKYYTGEEKMLAENECDAVYIGTPVSCHLSQANAALKYGRNVFIEKPITITSAEGEELVKAYKKAGKQITVGYMMKYHNLHEKAKRLIKSGAIGEVSDVRAQFTCWYPDIAGAWRQNKKLGGGGAIMDLGVHIIELVEYILNDEIAEVKSFYSTKTFSYEVEDCAVVAFRTKKGVQGHFDVNFNVPDDASESKLEFYGTDGYIIANGTLGQEEVGTLKYLYAPQKDYAAMQTRSAPKPKKFKGRNGDLYLKQIQAFVKRVKSGKPEYKNAEKAVHVQKVVEKIYDDDKKL